MAGEAEFKQLLERVTRSEEYLSLDTNDRDGLLRAHTEIFNKSNPQSDLSLLENIAADRNRDLIRIQENGRRLQPWDKVTDQLVTILPDDFDTLSKQDKLGAIESARDRTQGLAQEMDFVNKHDLEYQFNAILGQEERVIRGEDTSFVGDKFARIADGVVNAAVSPFNADKAKELNVKLFPENPKMDESFLSKLSFGAGDFATQIGMFVAVSAAATPGVATGTLFAQNASRRFQENYNRAVDLGFDENVAIDAGFASLPGSVIDSFGDRLIAGRFIPSAARRQMQSELRAATTDIARTKIISKFAKQAKGRFRRGLRDSLAEGLSEAGGDFGASFGGYLTTGNEEFKATPEQLFDSFAIGAILGGTASIAAPNQETALRGLRNADVDLEGASRVARNEFVSKFESGDLQGALGVLKDFKQQTEGEQTDGKRTEERSGLQEIQEGREQPSPEDQHEAGITDSEVEEGQDEQQNRKLTDQLVKSISGDTSVDEELDKALPQRKVFRDKFLEAERKGLTNQEDALKLIETAVVKAAQKSGLDPAVAYDNLSKIEIVSTDNQAQKAKEAGTPFIQLNKNADFDTLTEELTHVIRQSGILAKAVGPELNSNLEREYGVQNGQWNTDQEERFVDEFVGYLRSGRARNSILQNTFDRIKEVFKGIYENILIAINPKTAFDKRVIRRQNTYVSPAAIEAITELFNIDVQGLETAAEFITDTLKLKPADSAALQDLQQRVQQAQESALQAEGIGDVARRQFEEQTQQERDRRVGEAVDAEIAAWYREQAIELGVVPAQAQIDLVTQHLEAAGIIPEVDRTPDNQAEAFLEIERLIDESEEAYVARVNDARERAGLDPIDADFVLNRARTTTLQQEGFGAAGNIPNISEKLLSLHGKLQKSNIKLTESSDDSTKAPSSIRSSNTKANRAFQKQLREEFPDANEAIKVHRHLNSNPFNKRNINDFKSTRELFDKRGTGDINQTPASMTLFQLSGILGNFRRSESSIKSRGDLPSNPSEMKEPIAIGINNDNEVEINDGTHRVTSFDNSGVPLNTEIPVTFTPNFIENNGLEKLKSSLLVKGLLRQEGFGAAGNIPQITQEQDQEYLEAAKSDPTKAQEMVNQRAIDLGAHLKEDGSPQGFVRGGIEASRTVFGQESFWTQEENLDVAEMYKNSAGIDLNFAGIPEDALNRLNRSVIKRLLAAPESLKKIFAYTAIGGTPLSPVGFLLSGEHSAPDRFSEEFKERLVFHNKEFKSLIDSYNDGDYDSVINNFRKANNKFAFNLVTVSRSTVDEAFDNDADAFNFYTNVLPDVVLAPEKSITKVFMFTGNIKHSEGTGTVTPDFVEQARAEGFNTIWNKDAIGGGLVNFNQDPRTEKADEIVALSPSQVKSADAITRDQAGRVIPLSKRFNRSEESILFQEGFGAAGNIPNISAEQDQQYLEAVNSGDLDTAKSMVEDAAVAAGYSRKGIRRGFYKDGVPLEPSFGANFGPGFYIAEDADTNSDESFSVRGEPNPISLRNLGLTEEEVEFRSEEVAVKADRPLVIGQGRTILTDEQEALINSEMELQSEINQAFSATGLHGYIDPSKIAKIRGVSVADASIFGEGSANRLATIAKLIREGRLPFDSIRGIGGRTVVDKLMSSELVVMRPEQVKSIEPITNDKDGNVIPLSERFNQSSPSILRQEGFGAVGNIPDIGTPQQQSQTAQTVSTDQSVAPESQSVIDPKKYAQARKSTRWIRKNRADRKKIENSEDRKIAENLAYLGKNMPVMINMGITDRIDVIADSIINFEQSRNRRTAPTRRRETRPEILDTDAERENFNQAYAQALVDKYNAKFGPENAFTGETDPYNLEEVIKWVDINNSEDLGESSANPSEASESDIQEVDDAIARLDAEFPTGFDGWIESYEDFEGDLDLTNDQREHLLSPLRQLFDHLKSLDTVGIDTTDARANFIYADTLLNVQVPGIKRIGNVAYQEQMLAGAIERADTFKEGGMFANQASKLISKGFDRADIRVARVTSVTETQRFMQNQVMQPLDLGIQFVNNKSKALGTEYEKNRDSHVKDLKLKDADIRSEFAFLTTALILPQVSPLKDFNEQVADKFAQLRKAIKAMRRTPNKNDRETADQFEKIVDLFESLLPNGLDSPNLYNELVDIMPQALSFDDDSGSTKRGEARVRYMSKVTGLFEKTKPAFKLATEMYRGPFQEFLNYAPTNPIATAVQGPNQVNVLEDPLGDGFLSYRSPIDARTSETKSRVDIGDRHFHDLNMDNYIPKQIVAVYNEIFNAGPLVELAKLFSKDSEFGEIVSNGIDETRVELIGTVNQMVQNTLKRGEHIPKPIGLMNGFVRQLGKIHLGSVVKFATEPTAAYTHFFIRRAFTGKKPFQNLMQAFGLMRSRFGEYWSFLEKHNTELIDRAAGGEVALDRRPFNELKNTFVKMIGRKIDDTTGKVLFTPLRWGDGFASHGIFLSEYFRLEVEAGRATTHADLDLENPNAENIRLANRFMEEFVGLSGKERRAAMFSDNTVAVSAIRNLILSYSHHLSQLGQQLQRNVSDIYLNIRSGRKDQLNEKIRDTAGILGQIASFSAMRFAALGAVATLIQMLLKELYDDEEGKIAELEKAVDEAPDEESREIAEQQLQFATIVRDVMNKFERQTKSGDSLFKSMVRDQLTGVHIVFGAANGFIPNTFIMGPIDKVMSDRYRQSHEEHVRALERTIREEKNPDQKRKLKEDLVNLKDKTYIPFHFKYPSTSGVSGIYGSVMESVGDVTTNVLGDWVPRALGQQKVTDFHWSDFLVNMQLTGIGQSDVNRVLRKIDAIEENKWKAERDFIRKKEREEKEKGLSGTPLSPDAKVLLPNL